MVPTPIHQFAEQAIAVLRTDPNVTGLAVAGSWLTQELDAYSDLDLILITNDRLTDDPARMRAYADRLGQVLAAFTGEHVGEPRVLICLYDEPLLHVDLKFLTLPEFYDRVENPTILWERDGRLSSVLAQSEGRWPFPDYVWLEDRFWVWVHYAASKIGRGEYFEALDFLSFLRVVVLGPLLHIQAGSLPRGVRKLEFVLKSEALEQLEATVATTEPTDLWRALRRAIELYRQLRSQLFPDLVSWRTEAENRVVEYIQALRQGS